jgi:hypothetical protein
MDTRVDPNFTYHTIVYVLKPLSLSELVLTAAMLTRLADCCLYDQDRGNEEDYHTGQYVVGFVAIHVPGFGCSSS